MSRPPEPGRAAWLPPLLLVGVAWLVRSPWLLGIDHYRWWWDEKFIFENARDLGLEGRWLPATVYYPALAHYAQALLLYAWKAGTAARAALGGAVPPPLEFGFQIGLARIAQSLLGALNVAVVYAIGRRLYSARTGLLAAAFLAFSPWHIAWSGVLKPAASLMLFHSLAFWSALRTRERPGPGCVLLAGALVGASVSCAYNGVTAALPLVLVALAWPAPRRRSLGWLFLAGAASLATFALLNPRFLLEPRVYLGTLTGFSAGYGAKEASRGFGVGWLVYHFLELVGLGFLGWFAALVLAAALPSVGRDLRTLGLRGAGSSHGLLLAVIVAHGAFTIWMTKLFFPHHFSPALPYLCVLAGWGAERLLARLAGARAARPLALRAAVWAGFGLLVCSGAWTCYRGHGIRTTAEAARDWLARREGHSPRILTWGVDPAPGPGALALDRAERIPPGLVEGADLVLLPAAELGRFLRGGPRALPLAPRELLSSPGVRFQGSFRPAWPHTLGPALALFAGTGGAGVLATDRTLGFGDFRITGEGGADAELLWLRGLGSSATLKVAVEPDPGEELLLEVVAAADDSGVLDAAAVRLELSLDGEPEVVELAPTDLRRFRSRPCRPSRHALTVRLAYRGAEGGRLYLTEARLLGLVPVREATSTTVRRLRERDAVRLEAQTRGR